MKGFIIGPQRRRPQRTVTIQDARAQAHAMLRARQLAQNKKGTLYWLTSFSLSKIPQTILCGVLSKDLHFKNFNNSKMAGSHSMLCWKHCAKVYGSGTDSQASASFCRHKTRTIKGFGRPASNNDWVNVKELKLSYYKKETLLFTIYPFQGSLR